MNFQIPYFVYWLIIRDLTSTTDSCIDSLRRPGFCMSDVQCLNIVNGTVIGSCESESSELVCCMKTTDYYNETYYMTAMYAEDNLPSTTETILRTNRKAYHLYPTNYCNKTIPSDAELEVAVYNDTEHVCIPPDRIIWPVRVSYENIRFKIRSPTPGRIFLYIVAFNKLYNEDKRNLTVECLKSNVSQSDYEENCLHKFYVKIIDEESFPLKKFFTPVIQNLRTTNYTDDIESLFEETEPQERRRRSPYASTCMDHTNFEKDDGSRTVVENE